MALGDEKNAIFECQKSQCLREEWSHLVQGLQTMQAFMWQDDLIGIAVCSLQFAELSMRVSIE